MSLAQELTNEVRRIFREQWKVREGRKVPEVGDLTLGNDAVKLEGAVLYADLAASTKMVDQSKWTFAAEVYKSYLLCASKVIRAEGGVITAFDGDRVMAVFIGDRKNSNAARCALKIKYALTKIVNPLLKEQYPDATYDVNHVVGIDTSLLHVARTGVWGANDLVWVGRAANHAAKLSSIDAPGHTYVSEATYNALSDDTKYGGSERKLMWERRTWNAMADKTIYRSSWTWKID